MSGAREDSSSLTLESLLKKNNLSEAQVNVKIEDHDLIGLAEQFDGVEDYIDHEQFGLKPAQKVDVRELKSRSCSEAVKLLLRYWKQKNPHQATFKVLLKILLERSKTKVALDVCGYVKTRQLETSETQGTSQHAQGTSETQGTSQHTQGTSETQGTSQHTQGTSETQGTSRHTQGTSETQGTSQHTQGTSGTQGTSRHTQGTSETQGTSRHTQGTSETQGTSRHTQGTSETQGTSRHTQGTCETQGTSQHTQGTSETQGTSRHAQGTSGTQGTSRHTQGTSGTQGTSRHTQGTSETQGTSRHAQGTSETQGTSDHTQGTGETQGTSRHTQGTSETQGTSRHTQGTSETQGTSQHAQETSEIPRTSQRIRNSHPPWQFNMKTISIVIAVIAITCVPMVLVLKNHQDSPRTVIPQSHDLIMTDFEQHKKEDDMWYSPPVYTHQDGYKICLGIFANGELDGEGTHVTVAVYFMRGEFDDLLKWPFRGIIYFQLVDQLHGVDHLEHVVPYNSSVPDKHCSRVTDRDTAEWGWGPDRLIAHTKLEPKYLRKDCLKFRIHKVELH